MLHSFQGSRSFIHSPMFSMFCALHIRVLLFIGSQQKRNKHRCKRHGTDFGRAFIDKIWKLEHTLALVPINFPFDLFVTILHFV